MQPSRTAPAIGLALTAALAAVPAADAATVATSVSCVRVVPGVKSFPVTASGFAANALLTFRSGDHVIGSGITDANGNFDTGANPFVPFLPAGRNTTTYQLTADDGNGTVAGPVPVRATAVKVVVPARARPTKRVKFRVLGFRTGKRVYLHIRRGGKTKGRFSLGRAKGACGRTTKKMRFMPLRHYGLGVYHYYFSHSRRFDPVKVIYGGRVTIGRA